MTIQTPNIVRRFPKIASLERSNSGLRTADGRRPGQARSECGRLQLGSHLANCGPARVGQGELGTLVRLPP